MVINQDTNQDLYISIPKKKHSFVYSTHIRDYLLEKYKDGNTYVLYLYFIENLSLKQFYKQNDTILSDLKNFISEPTLIKCKKNLMNEGVLQEIKVKNHHGNCYTIQELELNIDCNNPVIKPTKKSLVDDLNILSYEQKNFKSSEIDKSLEKQQIKSDFKQPNINNYNINKENINKNKVCANNIYGNIEKDYSLPHSHEDIHTQKEYLNSIKQNNTKQYNTEELESHKLLEQIQILFKEHAPHRLQELTALQINPNITTAKLTNINKKLKDTKNNYIDFFKWLGGEKPRQFIILAGIHKILDSIDKQVNFYLQDKINKEKEEKEKTKFSKAPFLDTPEKQRARKAELDRLVKEEREKKQKEKENAIKKS
jgi:small nuclear ribonucleoprotein (snRNP)-like protein